MMAPTSHFDGRGSKIGLILLKPRGLLREFGRERLKRRRMRCRRLHVYSADPRRPQGHLIVGD